MAIRAPSAMQPYTHDKLIDTILARPHITIKELAEIFGYTPVGMRILMSSDAFQARMSTRREEVIDPLLQSTIEDRFSAVAKLACERLVEKLSAPAAALPDNLVLRAAELGAKVFAPQQVRVQLPPADHLEILARRLTALQGGAAIDGEFIECPST